MTENDTCDTFKSRNDNTITLLLCKRELKMAQNTKNIYSSLHNGGGIMARKGGFNRGVLTIGNKTPE